MLLIYVKKINEKTQPVIKIKIKILFIVIYYSNLLGSEKDFELINITLKYFLSNPYLYHGIGLKLNIRSFQSRVKLAPTIKSLSKRQKKKNLAIKSQ